jgi:hypothetical protein
MTEFEIGFQEVVREFLHTVVVLDDHDPNESPDVSVPKQIDTPEGVMAVTEDTSQEVIPPRISISTEFSSLVRKYANLGLVCAVIKPEEAEFQQIGVEIAKRADITILDWRMFDSDGTHTLELIGGIVQSDMEGAGRQRLIVIYTLEPKLSEIIQRVNQKLSEVGVEVTPGDFSLKSSSLSIVVYQKDSATTKPVPNRVATFDDLPEKTIQEFARANNGLLAKVALKGISTVRSETHHILKNLDKTMDEPYVAHRIMLEDPRDAEAFASDLVLGQIRDAFALMHVGQAVNTNTVQAWLKDCYSEDHSFVIKNNRTRLELEKIIEEGLEKVPADGAQITHAFVGDSNDADHRNRKFSQLSTLVREHIAEQKSQRYGTPVLAFGSILEMKDGEEVYYWLCLQPNCDSVRIEGKRAFPFIKLEVRTLDKSFDLIVNNSLGQPVYLRTILKPHEMRHFEFASDTDRQLVLSEKPSDAEGYVFQSLDSKKFFWVADLKFEYAQRIANNFAAQISRVGFDEFEWLRRKSSSK